MSAVVIEIGCRRRRCWSPAPQEQHRIAAREHAEELAAAIARGATLGELAPILATIAAELRRSEALEP